MTVRQRLILLSAIIVLGVGALIGTSFYEIESVYKITNLANEDVVPSLEVLDRARTEYLLVRVKLNRHVLTFDEAEMQSIEAELFQSTAGVDAALRAYETNGCTGRSCIDDDEDRFLLQQLKAKWADYKLLIEPIVNESRKGIDGIAIARNLVRKAQPLANDISKTFDEHIAYNVRLAEKASQRASAEIISSHLILGSASFGLLLSIAFFLYQFSRNLQRQLGTDPQILARIADDLASGRRISGVNYTTGDNTSVLARISLVAAALYDISKKAREIGKGNLGVEIPRRSEDDELSSALADMLDMLKASQESQSRQNWLKECESTFTIGVSREQTVVGMAREAIVMLGSMLGAGRAIIYKLTPDEITLAPIAGYMISENMPNYRMGTGLIGQVADQKAPISISLSDEGRIILQAGTAPIVLKHFYSYPLIHQSTLVGVLEVAVADQLDDVQLALLVSAVGILGSFLYAADQQVKVQEALELAKVSERSVREANLQLEQRQSEIQQQNEEIQQANALMEEQQQQLQQQTEELQQTNAQMEESQIQLQQQNEELQQSQKMLDERAKQINEASQYKTDFLANMSHELRTPLNSIILLSKMMVKAKDDETIDNVKKWAEVVHQSGQDLLLLINDVLDLSKIEAGHANVDLSEIDFNGLADNFRDTFGPQCEQKQIGLEIRNNLQNPIVSDLQKVLQILRNLLSNAIKFCKEGKISVTAEWLPTKALPIRILVKDTGIGIPKEKQRAIFEAFQQADGSTSREFGGTGLGLTISLKLANLIGGTIELHSEVGKGSEFSLLLPDLKIGDEISSLAKSTPITSGSLAGLMPEDDGKEVSIGDKVILVIDDDPKFAQAIMMMNRGIGYKTLLAGTGGQALETLSRIIPDGIILDLGLPDIDGAELLHKFKTSQSLRSIPVYIVSASDRNVDVLKLGAIDFIQKPVDQATLEHIQAFMVNLSRTSNPQVLLSAGEVVTPQEIRDLLNRPDIEISVITTSKLLDYDTSRPTIGVFGVNNQNVESQVALAKTLKAQQGQTFIIFICSDSPVLKDDSALRELSSCLITKSDQSPERIQSNVEFFLRNITDHSRALSSPLVLEDSTMSLKGKRLLVVDDDPRNLFTMTVILEKEGAAVKTAINGRKALSVLEEHSFDLVLMDIMMPEMNGYEAMQEIRKRPAIATIPIIAVSAKAMPEDRAKAISAGANDYITKPAERVNEYETAGLII